MKVNFTEFSPNIPAKERYEQGKDYLDKPPFLFLPLNVTDRRTDKQTDRHPILRCSRPSTA